MPDPFKVAIDRRYGDLLLEFWRDEGAQTAVSVRASEFQHVLYLDGLHQANDQPAMVKLHRTIGHLPMVLHGTRGRAGRRHRRRRHAGRGQPAPGRARPGRRAVRQRSSGRAVLRARQLRPADPAQRQRADRRWPQFPVVDRCRFDVITADIIQPGHAGAGHVYSREYFTLVRNALKDDGVALQWIGHRPSVEYNLIMRTFLDVFPHATLWNDANFMVGTQQPLDRSRRRSIVCARTSRRAPPDAIGLTTWADLRSWYTAGPTRCARLSATVRC